MNVPALSAVVLATTVLVVGGWHLLLWSRRRELRVHLGFGLTCLSLAFYDVACAGLYQSTSVAQGVGWQTLQSLGLVFGGVAFCWFVFDYTGRRWPIAPLSLTLAQLPIVLALATGHRALLLSDTPSIKHVTFPLGISVTYYETAPAVLSDYQAVLGVLLFGYAVYAATMMVRRKDGARGVPLLLATSLFFAGAANDAMVQLGWYSFFYVLEFSFLGLVLLMTYAITEEVVRAQSLSAALVLSEERYRQFVEGTEDLVVRSSQDGYLLFANHGAERVLGLADAQGKPCIDFVHVDDKRRTLQVLGAAIGEGRRHAALENRIVGATGEVRDVLWTVHFQHSVAGRVSAINAIGRDITRRKRMEAALRESEQAYQALVESALQAVAVFDGARYVFVNARMTEIFGWSRDEFLAMSEDQAIRIVHPDDRSMVIERRRARQAGQIAPSVYEFRVVRKDGEVRWVQVFANAIAYRGRPCSLAVYVDITDRQQAEEARRQAEEERERLEAQLRHAQKMQAVGQLAGGVAHDFNNLLQAIVGYTQLARRLVDDSSPARKHLEQVLAASDRAASLTRQLLAFSRTEAIQPRLVQVNDLIADLMKMLRRVLGEQIELSIRTHPDVGTSVVDHGQVEQVLMNLCINARDAMPSGGRLSIETARLTLDDRFCSSHPWALPKAYVVVTVADTGTGIPAAIRERIFEPFFTTKEVGRGTGLGLATVYAIVERHGGGVTVESEEGAGSRFRVFLPASEQTHSDFPDAVDERTPAGGAETILIAEDDDVVRILAITVLQEAGYHLVVARDGDEAIRLMQENEGSIDLALIDVVMPGKGGIEVRDAIRSSSSRIPVLFSTGYSPGTEDHRARSLAGEPVLLKPYQPKDLLRAVRQMLDSRVSNR